jgi:hypothetical protein
MSLWIKLNEGIGYIPGAVQSGVVWKNNRWLDSITHWLSKELLTTSQLLQRMCLTAELELSNAGQYLLCRTPTVAYLSYLCQQGVISYEIEDNEWRWKKENK